MRFFTVGIALVLVLLHGSEPSVIPNDNRTPAGTMRDGALVLQLEARLGVWHPDGDSAPGVLMPAFAEAGRSPQIPGPLIRVTAGTEVTVTVRNSLQATLDVYGLQTRPVGPATPPDPLRVAPGKARTLRFRLDLPGTYYYWGTTMGRSLEMRTREDAQLSGAIVVDPLGGAPAPDRILLVGIWSDTAGRSFTIRQRMLATVNGRSWPHTERLAYRVGDTVRLRIINASGDRHPMHLHGFYYRVDSRGDWESDTVYAAARQDLVNTESMLPGGTFSLTWVPTRAGNWLFHCHLPEHFAPRGPLGTLRAVESGHSAGMNHALEGMSGLVMGIHVSPLPGAEEPALLDERMRRRLRLLIRPNLGGTTTAPLYGFSLQEFSLEPPPDSGATLGPPIVLTQDEPVSITVVNRTPEPTAVHWHGIELESYFDGVAGWSGDRQRVSPAIEPGDSFEVRFTPPRAGTFIYHTHLEEERQMLAGLVGPLIVLPPGERYNPTTDLPVLLTTPRDTAADRVSLLINGVAEPAPLQLKAGTRYRFRFINMSLRRPGIRVELKQDSLPARWRWMAKDGMDLPPARQALRAARAPVGIGETVEVELTPEKPGELRLEVVTGPGAVLAVWRMVVRQ